MFSLECYTCTSDDSFHSCNIKRSNETCQTRAKCGKLSFDLPEGSRYRKGCLSVIYCSDPDRYCQSIIGAENCHVSCCSKDVCNSTTSRDLNSVLLFWSALISVKFALFYELFLFQSRTYRYSGIHFIQTNLKETVLPQSRP